MAGLPEEVPAHILSEALTAESEARDLAFLLDMPQPLCGVPVLPLDLRNQIILSQAGNPFLVGGRADIFDVRMVLWAQSPLYRAADEAAREKFLALLPTIEESAAVAEVRAWIDATFADAPPGKTRKAGGEGAILEEPIASFVASWVDLLGSEYGWSEEQIVGTADRRGVALQRLYQYQRMILRRYDPKRSFTSNLIAKLTGIWLRASIAADEAAAKKEATA